MTTLREWYPASMLEQGISGEVLLGYSVSSAGAAVRVETLKSSGPAFTQAALEAPSGLQFIVPPHWAAQQGPERRYRVELQYWLKGQPQPQTWDPEAHLITVTGQVR